MNDRSTTPRVDAYLDASIVGSGMVDCNFARQLECKLNKALLTLEILSRHPGVDSEGVAVALDTLKELGYETI